MSREQLIGTGWAFPVGTGYAGSIAMSSGTGDIEQAIRIILGTSPGERVMRPNFGCRIHELAFAPIHGETIGLAKRYVEEALGWWEPRIDVVSVEVEPDRLERVLGKLNIQIVYTVRETKDERTLVYPFYLMREE